MALNKEFYISTSLNSYNMGNVIPPWNLNFDDKNSWYMGNQQTDYYFYNFINNTCFIQYGMNDTMWATCRFWGQLINVTNEIENPDGSITADVTVTPLFWKSRKTDFALSVGYNVIYDIKINNETVYYYAGATIDQVDYPVAREISFTVNVMPQSRITNTAFTIDINYPNGEVPNSSTIVGITLVNNNVPSYKPMSIRKNNTWNTINVDSGFIKIRKSNVWLDRSNENNSTSLQENEGKNRIRKNGKWLQLPRM